MSAKTPEVPERIWVHDPQKEDCKDFEYIKVDKYIALEKKLEIAVKALEKVASEYDQKVSFGMLEDRYYNIVISAKKTLDKLKEEPE